MADRPLTPEAFAESCRRCRPTKHLHGWDARDLGKMVQHMIDALQTYIEDDDRIYGVGHTDRSVNARRALGWPTFREDDAVSEQAGDGGSDG